MKFKLFTTLLVGILAFSALAKKPLIDFVAPHPIEVMSRSDIDENGLLEGVELEFAASLYELSLIEVANLEGDDQQYAKSVFYYILIFKKIPSAIEVIHFHHTKNVGQLRIDYTALHSFFNLAFLNI